MLAKFSTDKVLRRDGRPPYTPLPHSSERWKLLVFDRRNSSTNNKKMQQTNKQTNGKKTNVEILWQFKFQAALLQRWNLPTLMCPFCPFVQVLSVNVSIFTLTAIAIDRHRAILSPLRFGTIFTHFFKKFLTRPINNVAITMSMSIYENVSLSS